MYGMFIGNVLHSLLQPNDHRIMTPLAYLLWKRKLDNKGRAASKSNQKAELEFSSVKEARTSL